MDWMSVSGWAFGAVGTVFGMASYFRAEWMRRNPPKAVLKSEIDTIPIGLPKDPLVRVTYNSRPLDTPTITTIALTNQGAMDVERFDRDAIKYRVSQSSMHTVEGVIGASSMFAEYDPEQGWLTFKPRVIKKGELMGAILLCDGPPDISADIRLANVDIVTNGRTMRPLIKHAIRWYAFAAVLSVLNVWLTHTNSVPDWVSYTLTAVVFFAFGVAAVGWILEMADRRRARKGKA